MKAKYLYVLGAACVAICGCANNADVTKQTQLLMGTAVEISVADPGMDPTLKSAVIGKAFDRIRQIEELMSSYNQISDVCRINSFADKRPVRVSPDTIKVIKKAQDLNEATGGAFDITVGPLVELWGFGPKAEVFRAPSDEEVRLALKSVGMDKLNVDYSEGTVNFASIGMSIDLSGIAKGYAVDCAAEVLRQNGVKNAVVNAGGDIFCMGMGPRQRPWKIGIRHPRVKNGLLSVVSLTNRAIATSGDYERFFFRQKRRVSHIIDPRTGVPVSDVPDSVSITAADCMTADALATAVFVLGPGEGLRVLEKAGAVDAMIAVDSAEGIKVYKTDGFGKE